MRGTVFEMQAADGPRVPSADAFLIVHWTGTRPGIGHYESVRIQAALARTDAQGRFELSEPPPLRSTFLVWRREVSVAVYKPGFDERYELRVRGAQHELTLAPTRADAAKRASYAEGISHLGCRDDQGMPVPLADPQKVSPAFRAALEAEVPPKLPPKVEVRIPSPGGPRPAAPQAR